MTNEEFNGTPYRLEEGSIVFPEQESDNPEGLSMEYMRGKAQDILAEVDQHGDLSMLIPQEQNLWLPSEIPSAAFDLRAWADDLRRAAEMVDELAARMENFPGI